MLLKFVCLNKNKIVKTLVIIVMPKSKSQQTPKFKKVPNRKKIDQVDSEIKDNLCFGLTLSPASLVQKILTSHLEHNLSLDWLVAGVAVVRHIQVIIIQHGRSIVRDRSSVLIFTHGTILGKCSIYWRDVRILRGEIRVRVHLNEHCVA